MIVLSLPVPVSANRYWRPVTIPGKAGARARQITVPSKEAKAYKDHAAWVAKAAGIRKPIAGRVEIHVEYYPQRPQDWAKRSQRDPDHWDDTVMALDVDNISKCLLDSLKGIVFEDDKFVWAYSIARRVPDGESRIIVTINALAQQLVQPSLLEVV